MGDIKGGAMNVVQTADINKVFDERITALENDPATKQSVYAAEVGKFAIELLNEVRAKVLTYSSEIQTRRYKGEL